MRPFAAISAVAMVARFLLALPFLGGAAAPWNLEDVHYNPQTMMRSPPSQASRGNRVNVSIFLTDVHGLNEAEEKVSVYALIRLWWRDPRWREVMMQHVEDSCSATNCTAADMARAEALVHDSLNQSLFGQSADAFFEAASEFGKQIPNLIMVGNVWTPIPVHLQLKTSSNPRGLTEFDPIIGMTVPASNDFEAFWIDSEKTVFEVSLSYELYPFDTQLLELCIPFDYFTDPYFQPTLNGPGGSPMPGVIDVVATRWDVESEISSIASQRFVENLEKEGFFVLSIEPVRVEQSLATTSICIKVTITRRITILILRFFWPLTALLFIPFAGFFIPIDLVMPRVATGFVSFLSLQVFRSIAYALIPKQTSSLLWMDVTMFCVTVIMFASVLENVLAQALRATVSTNAAKFLDEISKISFPLVAVIVLAVLFILGAANMDVVWIMTIMLCILAGWLVGFAVAVVLYLRWLPHKLVNILIRQIASTDFRYQKAIQMDSRELALIFKTFDKDGTGDLSAQELIESLEIRGLRFQKFEDEQHFKARMQQMFRQSASETLDLSAFCHHFGDMFSFGLANTQPSETKKDVLDHDTKAELYL